MGSLCFKHRLLSKAAIDVKACEKILRSFLAIHKGVFTGAPCFMPC